MQRGIWILMAMLAVGLWAAENKPIPEKKAPRAKPERAEVDSVYVLPIRWDIMPPLLHLLDRGFKEAESNGADLVILNIHTNGGRVDVTEKILKMIDDFDGEVVAFVNDKAISAGALISVGAKAIYLKPGGRIGDAAPVLMAPGGAGAQELPGTMEEKVNSYVRSLARREAQENGHSVEIVEAMINKERELWIAGEMVCPKGELLTLTAKDAERIGFSSGTKENLDAVLAAQGLYDGKTGRNEDKEKQGLKKVTVTHVEQSTAENWAQWFDSISPVLLMVGLIGLYVEVKTPGFGVPGIVGITALVFYFLGGSVAHFTGNEQMVMCLLLFLIGLGLIIVELYVMPGMAVFGVLGLAAMLVALVIAPIDLGSPTIPDLPIPVWQLELQQSVWNLILGLAGAGVGAAILAQYLPKTRWFEQMAPASASGVESVIALEETKSALMGQEGVADTTLRPSGRAMINDQLIDVMSKGDFIEAGERVRIIGHSGSTAVVEKVE